MNSRMIFVPIWSSTMDRILGCNYRTFPICSSENSSTSIPPYCFLPSPTSNLNVGLSSYFFFFHSRLPAIRSGNLLSNVFWIWYFEIASQWGAYTILAVDLFPRLIFFGLENCVFTLFFSFLFVFSAVFFQWDWCTNHLWTISRLGRRWILDYFLLNR
jgi:hypothetical protein